MEQLTNQLKQSRNDQHNNSPYAKLKFEVSQYKLNLKIPQQSLIKHIYSYTYTIHIFQTM